MPSQDQDHDTHQACLHLPWLPMHEHQPARMNDRHPASTCANANASTGRLPPRTLELRSAAYADWCGLCLLQLEETVTALHYEKSLNSPSPEVTVEQLLEHLAAGKLTLKTKVRPPAPSRPPPPRTAATSAASRPTAQVWAEGMGEWKPLRAAASELGITLPKGS